ncbi:DMT family transporter [Geothrix sp. SG200]|uniref:DMT family transporter n=1 Tax=Geothrix sp. SG200 TaxID=2922865 RepID=UPI001FAD9C11|nr:DMT family transporter [Geothrix sp. SG200]
MPWRRPSSWPLPAALILVLAGFSANSLLCRAALGSDLADAASFSFLRLGGGALALLLLLHRGRSTLTGALHPGRALALAAYALTFSFAYRALTAGTGALLLFGAVQATLFGLALASGEQLTPRKGTGAALAFAGLLVLTLPSAHRPQAWAALLMLVAGAAWGAYTWLGRGSSRALVDTAAAFLGATALALGPLLLAGNRHLTPTGALLALASGTLASGATYALWYTVVPRLGAIRAAVAQLAVPPLTAAAGAAWLGEVPGAPWFLAAALTLGGIGLALTGASPEARREEAVPE